MSSQTDLQLIKSIAESLDRNRIARFSYTDKAFDDDDADGVENFDKDAEQNVPLKTHTEYAETVLNKGLRAQGASIPRMGWNHFLGRASYNLNKLVQKIVSFFDVTARAWAHNAFEYDAAARYRQGDICYLISTVGTIKVYTWYIRKSSTPETITDIPPPTPLHWEEVQDSTSHSSLLPFLAPGYRHKYTVIDLTSGDYGVNIYYPVTTAPGDFDAVVGTGEAGVMQVHIEAFCNGTVAGLSGPQRAELGLISKFTGFAQSSTDIIINNSFVDQTTGAERDTSTSPIGFSRLVKGRQAVIWLRGGSRYALWNDFGSAFTMHTDVYNNGVDEPIAPGERVFQITPGSLRARFYVEDATAPSDAVSLRQVSGSLPLPKNLVGGTSLDAVKIPGLYIAPTAEIANSLGHLPVAAPGPFEMTVEGDKAGNVTTTQRLMVTGTGNEYTRVFVGATVAIPWYLSTSPEGTGVNVGGLYRFAITEAGDLVIYHRNGDDVPDFWIDENGHLLADVV
jgi:hypothetical protein